MAGSIWIASALGLLGGVALAYAVAKPGVPRMIAGAKDGLLLARLALAGTLIALLPALFLSLVAGATLGGAWGRQIFAPYGLAASGAPIGLALGIALVFAGVVLSGTAAGILLGKTVLHYRR
ncbi:MAG: hypothetical protein AMJ64_14015 [Betaproteobacteria bacterium SG8_39]|nr:MAG: hypothetical protein AMJ64_14015 [Betaproteobacteria bacterium SG8_39]